MSRRRRNRGEIIVRTEGIKRKVEGKGEGHLGKEHRQRRNVWGDYNRYVGKTETGKGKEN